MTLDRWSVTGRLANTTVWGLVVTSAGDAAAAEARGALVVAEGGAGVRAGGAGCQGSPLDPAPGAQLPLFWGTATSAYQVEGAWDADGKGVSIWDDFTHRGHAANNETGDVADDFYHKFLEDIALMQSLGLRNFRLSIAWTRIVPAGRGNVNEAGLRFYVRLIDALRAACIEPHVTLYHWDLPLTLQREYGGWASPRVQDDFLEYATVVFGALAGRVKYWTTFNEPYTFCMLGYASGAHAPGRCTGCKEGGDSSVEPYMCAYNVVLAHAKAAAAFKRLVPDARLSINWNLDWLVPRDPASPADQAAVDRALDFALHIYADPLWLGRMPPSVHAAVPAVPAFTEEEAALLVAARPPYFALNHYSTSYVYDDPNQPPSRAAQTKVALNGSAIGPQAASEFLAVVPWGIREAINHVWRRYAPQEIIVTENGVDLLGEGPLPPQEAVRDSGRVDFFRAYLDSVGSALRDGAPLTGYFSWSLMDNFEWADGYAMRFGIVHVDFTDATLPRRVKDSARWLARFFGVAPLRGKGHAADHDRAAAAA